MFSEPCARSPRSSDGLPQHRLRILARRLIASLHIDIEHQLGRRTQEGLVDV